MDDLLERVHELVARDEPFALATVVRVERPASARPGMKAIILADGTLEGWVGGSCAHPIVVREALDALRGGAPRLVSLSPQKSERTDQEGVTYHPMTCHSGGTLEIYVEPMLPRPQLLLVGEAPLVATLARLGRVAGFAIWVADSGQSTPDLEADLRLPLRDLARRITPSTYAVVATMGNYDEEALEQIVGAGAGYIGFVASRKRADAVFEHLRSQGRAAEDLQRVKVPAGLDIGAVTPEEIALSIMAEIVGVRRKQPIHLEATAAPRAATEAMDPVCGMTVEVATARHTYAYRGVTYYFCCARCQQTFEREPAQFLKVGT